jgi:hypothetical protein
VEGANAEFLSGNGLFQLLVGLLENFGRFISFKKFIHTIINFGHLKNTFLVIRLQLFVSLVDLAHGLSVLHFQDDDLLFAVDHLPFLGGDHL